MRMKVLRSTEKLFYFPNIYSNESESEVLWLISIVVCLYLFSTECQKCLEKYRSSSISYGLPHKVLILL